MKLKSINLFLMVMALVLSSTACSKKSSSSSGRSIDVVPLNPPPGDDDTIVDDDERTDDDEVIDDDYPVDDDDGGYVASNILFNNYRNTVPTTKVCTNVLQSRNAETLKKFFNWDIQNLEGPITVCIEQEAGPQNCLKGEDYCDEYPSRKARVRIEYEDDFKFWYYDSGKETNASKLLSYTGGNGSNTIELILQDGAGFFMVEGFKTSTGAYDVSFKFGDRPSYTQARNYDIANNYGSDSPNRRAATLWDLKMCASSANGAAKFTDGTDCASRFVLHYSFFTNMNTAYDSLSGIDQALWVKNQVTIARQYVNNQFSSQFSSFTGYKGGTFGRLVLNGL